MTTDAQPPAAPLDRPAAVLWDFDGTLVDSEPLWMRAQDVLIPEWGGTWSEEQAHTLVGNSLEESGRIIVEAVRAAGGRTDLTPSWVVDRLVERVVADLRALPIDWRPGAEELLDGLRRAGIPCALVSASYRVILEAVLERLPGGTFDVVVAGDEVVRGKPDPEPYLTACRRLGVAAEDTVVLEDSIPGCASGSASGAVVLGITNMVELTPAPRRVVLDTLAGVGVEELSAHVRSARESAVAGGAIRGGA